MDNGVSINLVKTERFKTIEVVITFITEFKKEYIPYASLLNTMLTKTNSKYKTSMSISRELESLYSANLYNKYSVAGNYLIMDFAIEFICPKYTEEKMYDKTINLFKTLIFEPNVVNGEFSKKEFDMYKEILLRNIQNLNEQNFILAESKYNKIIFKGTPYEYTPLNLIDLYKEVDAKQLYEFYLNILNNSNYIITVIGDYDEEKIKKNIRKLTNKLGKRENNLPSIYLDEIRTKKVTFKKEKNLSNQSTLLIGYKFYGITDFERKYVLTVYNLILGAMNNSILFVNVREKHSLCYSISSYIHKFVPALTIECGINKENYEKALEVIYESVNLMSNKNELTELFQNAMNTINLALNDYYEDVNKILYHSIFKEFNESDSVEEKRTKYASVTVEDIVKLNEKMILNTVYFLEGTYEKN